MPAAGLITKNRNKGNNPMTDELYKNQVDLDDVPDNAVIVDVRNGNEHSDMALKRKHYFIELPRFDAEEFIRTHGLTGETVYVLCQSGKRASVAARKLEDAGYKNVAIIKGGMNALNKKTDAVAKRSVISIERQVRIIAGSLVLAGSVLSLTLTPLGSVLSGLVGCGLLFAGITNSCSMAAVLSKMPWNK